MEESFARVNVHRHWRFDVPLAFAETAKDEEAAVAHDARIALNLVAFAALESSNVVPRLLNGVLVIAVLVVIFQESRALVFDILGGYRPCLRGLQ